MALRTPWQKQEVALLIDAYVRVSEGSVSRKEAIRELSSQLRQRASLAGLTIDDVYRNINGISMQMSLIERLMERKNTGLCNSSKLFDQMVILYKNDRNEFMRILIQGKGECGMTPSVKSSFFTWLADKVPAQLYSESENLYKGIEDYCLTRRVLTSPLFEITDIITIQRVKDVVFTSVGFKMRHFYNLGKMRKLISLYERFFEEISLENSVDSGNTGEDCDNMQESASSILINSDNEAQDDPVIMKWDFSCNKEPDNICKTNPVGIIYFDDEVSCTGWHDAYIKTVQILQEDYPSIIRGMVGYKFPNTSQIAWCGQNNLQCMNHPVEIADRLFLETAITPSTMIKIIRVVLDKCNVDSENLVLKYIFTADETVDTDVTSEEIISEKSDVVDDSEKNRQAFKSWMETQHMHKAAILSYLSDIKKCSEFAQQNGYISSDFFEISDWQTIDRILLALKKDPGFVELNEQRYKRPTSALHKLIMYRQLASENTATPTTTSEHTAKAVVVEDQSKKRYLSILAENFEDGFRYKKTIDKNRFKVYYSDKYGQDLTVDDEELIASLMSIGSVRDDRIFVKADSEQTDILSEIEHKIISTFDAGASCIYFDCLFNYFQSTLVEDLHIYSPDALEAVILSKNQTAYFRKYNFLCCEDRNPNPQADVIQYMINSLNPVSYSIIEKDLWFIPLDKIKQVLINTPQIVNVASETYFYAPNLPVNELELQQIAELIHTSLLQRSYISDVELTDLIEEHLPSVIVNTSEYTLWGRRNILAYLLRDAFSFRGAIISTKGEELSMSEVFKDFCKRTSHLSLDELRAFANELQTVIYWDSVYSEMVRINQNEFVTKEQIQFDTNKIDDLLDKLISGKYLSLKSMNNLFLHFPALSVKWNGYVLESFLVNYSKKFCLLHTGFSATDCCGAIVRRSSEFTDYRALIIDVLAQSTGWINKTDALQLLVDDGYQQRRSYKDIENVMLEAKLLREQVMKK